MSYESEPMRSQASEDAAFARSMAAERVKSPAILLIVVGVLDLLASGYGMYQGAVMQGHKEEFHKKFQEGVQQGLSKNTQASKQDKQKAEEMMNTMEKVVTGSPMGLIIVGLIGVFAAAVTIFGGVQMMSLRSRGLAILGAVLAALPCTPGLACCGVGEAIGIWSLIVLMSTDVKSAFR